jgi:hypothetical protein
VTRAVFHAVMAIVAIKLNLAPLLVSMAKRVLVYICTIAKRIMKVKFLYFDVNDARAKNI